MKLAKLGLRDLARSASDRRDSGSCRDFSTRVLDADQSGDHRRSGVLAKPVSAMRFRNGVLIRQKPDDGGWTVRSELAVGLQQIGARPQGTRF